MLEANAPVEYPVDPGAETSHTEAPDSPENKHSEVLFSLTTWADLLQLRICGDAS